MTTQTEATEQANRAGMDPVRMVAIFLLLTAIVLGMFLERIVAVSLAAMNVGDPGIVEGLDWRVSSLVGYVLSFGLAIFVWVNARTKSYMFEVASELLKVTWPGWGEVRTSTMAVLVASIISAIILFVIDNFALRLMVEWLPAVWMRL